MTHISSFFSAFLTDFKGKICVLLMAALVFGSVLSPAFAEAPNPKFASLVMDADTGLILSQSNATKRLHPASLTKMMTLLLTFDALQKGTLNLHGRIPVSAHAAGMAPSKLGLKPGQTLEVEDAIYALVTKSCNDVAAAVAEKIGGSEGNFARMMTARAREIGMTDTVFVNASGLHDPRQVSSARDMARLARALINDYPSYYHYFGTRSFTYKGQTMQNHNHLMETYKGMDGLKTGYIAPSGFNLVASAVQNHHRLIGVVFGGRTTKTRNATMANLLDQGFARIGDLRVASNDAAPTSPPANVPLPKAKPQILAAVASLNNLAPAAQNDEATAEGDYDPGENNQAEASAVTDDAGTVSAAALNPADIAPAPTPAPEIIIASADPNSRYTPAARTAAYATNAKSSWGIQIGAFASRAATDVAIQTTLHSLPDELAQANPIIMPLRTEDGFLFRGRLNGYSREQAFKACTYLNECMPVPPQE